MSWPYVVLIVLGGVLLLCLGTSLVCFFLVFRSKKSKPMPPDVYDIPPGKAYQEHREQIVSWIKGARELPHEQIQIKSFDGLRLVGYYYEYKKGAPMEIIFHGYRGNAERDVSGGIFRCHNLGRNVLIVDQRTAGKSEGRVITFGIRERRDCLAWIEYATERFGKDTDIIITGVSMGAATVVMAAACELPENVKAAVADCGYTSAREIIRRVIKKMGLPVCVFYPFVRLGALLFGGFRLESDSPIDCVRRARIPIIFIHGDADNFVPTEMSVRMHAECVSKKELFIVKGAGHGLAYPVDMRGYENALRDFSFEDNS